MAVTPYSSLADDRRMLDEYLGRGFQVARVEYVGRSWIRILEWETAVTRRRDGSPWWGTAEAGRIQRASR